MAATGGGASASDASDASDDPGARPTAARLRKSLFEVVKDDLADARVLDVCAGVGTLGFEALSRGARSCVFIERSRAMASLIERNATRLGLGRPSDAVRFELHVADAARALQRLRAAGRTFDAAFLDPPWSCWEAGSAASILARVALLAPALVAAEHPGSVEPPAEVRTPDPKQGPTGAPPHGPTGLVRTRTLVAGDGAFSLYRPGSDEWSDGMVAFTHP